MKLKIKKIGLAHIARHTDKRNARERGTDHAKGNQHPIAVSVTNEKGLVVGIAGGIPGHAQQKKEVPQHKGE